MSVVIAIDPGTTESAWVYLDRDKDILLYDKQPNRAVLRRIKRWGGLKSGNDHLVIEQFKNYGMQMGDSTITSIFWSGRFAEAWDGDFTLLPRKTVVSHICMNPKANDSNVRRAMLDRYPQTGGGSEPAKGTKGQPGPLYGIAKDMFSALALAWTYIEMKGE